MLEEFVFAGFGGQGIMFAGQVLAHAAMDEGYEVTWFPSYGPEMRGGTANCTVVISDRLVGSPLVKQPGVVAAFNSPSFEKYEVRVAPGGVLARNSSLVDQTSLRTDITELAVPATDLADELGDLQIANVVMLGAILAQHPILPLAAIRRALEAYIPARRRDMLPLNFAALARGASYLETLKAARHA